MDRIAAYTMCISFPFNKVTTNLYSEDETLKNYRLRHTMETIELIISSHGFITMSRIMDYLEFRPTRHCPSVVITEINNWQLEYDEINQTDVLTIWGANELKLRPVLKFNNEEEPEEAPKKEEPEWDITKTDSNKTGISESGGNEKT